MFSMFGDQSMRDYFSEIDDCEDLMFELYYKFSHEFFDINCFFNSLRIIKTIKQLTIFEKSRQYMAMIRDLTLSRRRPLSYMAGHILLQICSKFSVFEERRRFISDDCKSACLGCI